MATTRNDELNILNRGTVAKNPPKKRSVPFEEYFKAMGLTKDQIQDRIVLATHIEDATLFLFALIDEDVPKNVAITEYQNELYGTFTRDIDEYTEELTQKYSTDIVNATYDHITEEYYTSEDRAKFIAEDVANTYANYFDYLDATETKKTKTWHTENDLNVRPTHQENEGLTIPVDETFKVGGYLMRFPKDLYYGANDEEIINCRCWVTYK